MAPVVQPEPVTVEIDPGAGADIDETVRAWDPCRSPGEGGADDRTSAAVVGLHSPGLEQGEEATAFAVAEIDEQRRGVGVRSPRIDVRERMLETFEQEVVGRGHRRRRKMRGGRCLTQHSEQLAVVRDGIGDPSVDRRVPAKLLRVPAPQAAQFANGISICAIR